jgi:hypothetical protein
VISNYTIRPTFRRRQPYLKGVPSSPRPCALQTACGAANRRPLPRVPTHLAGPLLHLQGVQHRRAHLLQQRRILHPWRRRHFVGQSVMKFGVKHQACGVEEFVCKGVAIECLILEQGRMQADGDFSRVKAKAATADEFVAALLKPGHAQAVVVDIEPLDSETVGNPRQEHGFNMTGKRRQNRIHHVFWNAGRLGGDRRVGEWPTLFLAHVWATKHPLQEA